MQPAPSVRSLRSINMRIPHNRIASPMPLASAASTNTPIPQPTINASTHVSISQAQLEESTQKTESVDSDAPAAPSSGVFEPAPALFSLELSYPSLFSIATVMNGLSGSTDHVGFHNVTAMLISKANFVLKRVRAMPGLQNCQDPAYLFALDQVVSNFDLLCHQVDIIKDHPPQERAGIPMALEMTETALYCLKLFVEAAEHLASQSLQFVEPEPVLEPQLEATPKREMRTKAVSRRKMKVLEQKPLPDIPTEEPYNEYLPTSLRYSDTASSSKASLASESSDWNTSSGQSKLPSIMTTCTTPDTSPSVSPVEAKDSKIQVDNQFNQSTPTIVVSSTIDSHYDSPSPVTEEGDGVPLAEATDVSSSLLDVTAAVTPKKKLVASLFRLKTRFNSSTTLAAGEPGYFFAFQKGSKEDMRYNPRQSALWFPEDPLHPEVDVDMPMPTGGAAAVQLNNCGEIKAGTLNSLIRTLTSKEGVTNHEFITFFFLGRTSFTTPVEFFNELVSRYMEREPAGLTEQQKRVWNREVNTTRIRVGKTMVLWVNEYWIPGIDVEVLERMQMFSDDIMAKDLPRDLVDTFNKLLQRRIDGDNKNHRKKRSLDAFSTTELWFPQEIPILTGFKMPKEILGDMYFKLRLFDSESGRDEFARQITMTVAGIFRKVEPEQIVMYWRLKEMGLEKPKEEGKESKKCDMCGEAKKNVRGPLPLIPEQIKKKEEEIIREEEKERKRQEKEKPLGEPEMKANADLQAMIDFESSLALWVTYTILKVHLAAHRAQVISFWLKVADKCLKYRNFSGANCIFSGVAHSSVTRLHETVLLVPLESKLIFHKLDRFFSGHGNYKEFRMVLNGPATPVVPLITPLVRDVLSVREMPIKATAEFKGDTESRELISLCGYRIMMKTIRCLDNCRVPYNFSFEPVFQNWFASELSRWPPNKLNTHTDKFYARSNKRTEQGDDKRLPGLKISLVWMYICAGSGEWLGDDWVMQMIDPHMPMPTMDDKHKMAKLFSGMLGALRRKKGSKVPEKNVSI